MQLNSTQVAGLVAFVVAALGAMVAFMMEPRGRRRARRTWGIVATVHLLLAVEVVAMIRHRVEGSIGDWLRGAGEYAGRRPWQLAMILILTGVAIFIARGTIRRAPDRRSALALGATLTLLTLFAIESISLHAIDQIFYRPIGPILLIGWLWLGCASVTIASIGLKRRP